MSALKEWRQSRREAQYWDKARQRSRTLSEGEIVSQIDLALMTCGQAISKYRYSSSRENQVDQLLEVRLNLEAALGMLDNVL